MNDVEIKAEINSIINKILNEGNNELCKFLVKISGNANIRHILLKCLSTLPLSSLETLPVDLQKFVVGKLEEQMDDFKLNQVYFTHGSIWFEKRYFAALQAHQC